MSGYASGIKQISFLQGILKLGKSSVYHLFASSEATIAVHEHNFSRSSQSMFTVSAGRCFQNICVGVFKLINSFIINAKTSKPF